jgi:hypothetical protein
VYPITYCTLQYYSTAGGCKFGKACKYVHCEGKEGRAEVEKVDLNFLGLPLRPVSLTLCMQLISDFCYVLPFLLNYCEVQSKSEINDFCYVLPFLLYLGAIIINDSGTKLTRKSEIFWMHLSTQFTFIYGIFEEISSF